MAGGYRQEVINVALGLLCALVPVTCLGAANAAAPQPQRWALIIGVNRYDKESGVRSLPFCVNDAAELARTLTTRCGFPKDNVLLITDEAELKPTNRVIWNRLRTWLNLPKRGDTILVYFGCHGVLAKVERQERLYLMPSDGSRSNPARFAIPLSHVRERLAVCAASRKILILDACHAGAGRAEDEMSKTGAGEVRGIAGVVAAKSVTGQAGRGVVVLAACDADQKALEREDVKHGLFSYYLIEGLKGRADTDGDGTIVHSELVGYVTGNVERWAAKVGKTQTPIAETRTKGLLPVASVLKAPPPPPLTTKALMEAEFKAARLYDESARYLAKQKLANWKAFGAKFARQDFYDKAAYVAVRIAHWQKVLTAPEVRGWAKVSRQQIAYAQKAGLAVAKELDLGYGVTMKLVLIPSGEFMMGSEKGSSDERPVHRVKITKPFYMGVTEVTNTHYRRFKPSHDSEKYKGHSFNGDQQPVVRVSWNDATAFCDWLSRQTGRKVRLPTEAEWEYACRAGTRTRYWWGDSEAEAGKFANVADLTAKQEWSGWRVFDTDDAAAVSAPVGSYRANAFGLYDMTGNVWEWCQDCHYDNYYMSTPTDDSPGLRSGTPRVLRGGSWSHGPRACRSANRHCGNPTGASGHFYQVSASDHFYRVGTAERVVIPGRPADPVAWLEYPNKRAGVVRLLELQHPGSYQSVAKRMQVIRERLEHALDSVLQEADPPIEVRTVAHPKGSYGVYVARGPSFAGSVRGSHPVHILTVTVNDASNLAVLDHANAHPRAMAGYLAGRFEAHFRLFIKNEIGFRVAASARP